MQKKYNDLIKKLNFTIIIIENHKIKNNGESKIVKKLASLKKH